jgi:hypothetical protein
MSRLLCWLFGHRWDNYPDDRGRTLRLCTRRSCRGDVSEIVVGGFAFRLEPEDLKAAGVRFEP